MYIFHNNYDPDVPDYLNILFSNPSNEDTINARHVETVIKRDGGSYTKHLLFLWSPDAGLWIKMNESDTTEEVAEKLKGIVKLIE